VRTGELNTSKHHTNALMYKARRTTNILARTRNCFIPTVTAYRFFFAQVPTRSSAFSMFSIELATLKRK
jgi:hypothetical protein